MPISSVRTALAVLAALTLAACPHPAAQPQPPGDPYAHTPPPATAPPAGLDAATWTTHLREDLLPYWTMDAAKGAPVGNFPTYRRMDGAERTDKPNRKPRMMGRQVFTYSIGFLLTGDEALLDLARAGNRWLLDHGRDTIRGGWFADLDAQGQPPYLADKLAQDIAYAAMGPPPSSSSPPIPRRKEPCSRRATSSSTRRRTGTPSMAGSGTGWTPR